MTVQLDVAPALAAVLLGAVVLLASVLAWVSTRAIRSLGGDALVDRPAEVTKRQ